MNIRIKTYTSDDGDKEIHFYDKETNEWIWGYNQKFTDLFLNYFIRQEKKRKRFLKKFSR
jgi:hypothetical protein